MNQGTSNVTPDPHTMHCMEIWGDNHAVEEEVVTPGLDIWVFSEPYQADAQGGDVHYVSLCGGGIITRLILADVSGHGEAVARFSDALRSLMRRNINSKSQKRLVKALNREFTELSQMQRFATAVVATYLATTNRLSVCNAAHPRPIWYQAASRDWSILTHNTVQSIESAMNLPLGIDGESTYDQFTVQLRPGDFVIFYTDALTEARDPAGHLLGEEGLLTLVRELEVNRPTSMGPALLAAIRRHRAGADADDDVTLLVLHHNGGPARRPSILEKFDIYAKVFGLKSV